MISQNIDRRIQSILNVKDEIEQSDALEDLFFEAENALQQGEKSIAIAIYKSIFQIDLIEENLSKHILQETKKRLIELGIFK